MPCSPAVSPLHLTDVSGRTIVQFPGLNSLNCSNSDEVGAALLALLETRVDLWLDLAGIEYLTSMVLSNFLSLDGKARALGGRLTLINLRPTVRKVFMVSRLDCVLTIHECQAA